MTHSIVWFKRDLRTSDHAPLWHATQAGSVTCVYLIEPAIWSAPDAATQHYRFMQESLADLKAELNAMGLTLHILLGSATECLSRLFVLKPFDRIYSHQETGNDITYRRDRDVAKWCQSHRIAWHQYQAFGVKRGRHHRDDWQKSWDQFTHQPLLAQPTYPVDSAIPAVFDGFPQPVEFGLDPHDPPKRQRGGRRRSWATFMDFLEDRSAQYRGGISSPLSAPTACSRISAYLSWGCLSLKEVVQTTQHYLTQYPHMPKRQAMGLHAFISRLYWHCHFIQNLEDEPELEYRNLHPGYQGLRDDWQSEHFEALKSGQTGWPMVDASVNMLHETGWLNFRMRAMIVSVAAFPLWLDWPKVGHWLATQFLDYEPGIHWSQMQMQSGTTGINTARVYNPIKQAHDHDPNGKFVRQWLPALRKIPDVWLFEPWRMPVNVQDIAGVRVGQDIAAPLVDLAQATRLAKERFYDRRKQPDVRAGKAAILHKHGSRKRPVSTRRTTRLTANNKSAQLSFDF